MASFKSLLLLRHPLATQFPHPIASHPPGARLLYSSASVCINESQFLRRDFTQHQLSVNEEVSEGEKEAGEVK